MKFTFLHYILREDKFEPRLSVHDAALPSREAWKPVITEILLRAL